MDQKAYAIGFVQQYHLIGLIRVQRVSQLGTVLLCVHLVFARCVPTWLLSVKMCYHKMWSLTPCHDLCILAKEE